MMDHNDLLSPPRHKCVPNLSRNISETKMLHIEPAHIGKDKGEDEVVYLR